MSGRYHIERYHDISCGHRVNGHENKCGHLHGHNYRIYFYCEPDLRLLGSDDKVPQLDHIGRVIDFAVVKEKLCNWLEENWDHKFLVWEQDQIAPVLKIADPEGVILTTFNPTAENMAQWLVDIVGPIQLKGTGVQLVQVTIDETRKCSASYYI